jgi:CubicO group peptidase (beta-lactamase class C family)
VESQHQAAPDTSTWKREMTENPVADLASFALFTGAPQHENIPLLRTVLPTHAMAPASNPIDFPTGETIEMPATYRFGGESKSAEDFFVATDTAALLVVHDGVIRHERYALTGGLGVQWISMSVAKSVISALVGIAIAEGHIGGIRDAISDYVPVQPGSAYDGVRIKDVLQMSSGARWNEDYTDPTSPIFQLTAALAGIGTLDEAVATMVGESAPGTLCRYNSGDTQALGALLVRATKRSIADYMHEKLCEPLGLSSEGYWLIDASGMEAAYAGLNLTARDFAKFGELYRNNGVCNRIQVVPAHWVQASVTPDGPHVQSGQPIVGDHHFELGYGYQWWIPPGGRGEFSAIGVYNQFVYVDPTSEVVIVKLSANRAYGTTSEESTNRDHETVAFLQAIARHCGS